MYSYGNSCNCLSVVAGRVICHVTSENKRKIIEKSFALQIIYITTGLPIAVNQTEKYINVNSRLCSMKAL